MNLALQGSACCPSPRPAPGSATVPSHGGPLSLKTPQARKNPGARKNPESCVTWTDIVTWSKLLMEQTETTNHWAKGDTVLSYRKKPRRLDLNWRLEHAFMLYAEVCSVNRPGSSIAPGALSTPSTQILVSNYHFLLKGTRVDSRAGA